MEKEDIKEYINFIKARIKESFFKEETDTLHKGLKLMNISLDKYLKLGIDTFVNDNSSVEELPEINVLNLPGTPLFKKVINKMPKLSSNDETVMEDFSAVQLTLAFISFEYFRINGERDFALEYAQYLIKIMGKLKSRIGTNAPPYLNDFIENMSREAKILEDEKEKKSADKKQEVTKEDINRIHDSLHYLKVNTKKAAPPVQKSVHKIHFEDYGGNEFERLTFAYVLREKKWDKTPEWLGQSGSDGGRDIWAVFRGKTYCYLCANYQKLNYTKVKSDIDKLVKNKTIPENLIVVSGGTVSAELRTKTNNYAAKIGALKSEVWSGVEFEEKLRTETPELIQRFVNGDPFPELPGELIKLNNVISAKSDGDIINLIAECFDRPAFITPFYREASLPDFEKAITDTIEVLNTGVHRLRDGTIIRAIPTKHKLTDDSLKMELSEVTQLVIKLRDNFVELKRKKEIEPCGCGEEKCAIYMLSDKACKLMDNSRNEIFEKFKRIKPDFNLKVY